MTYSIIMISLALLLLIGVYIYPYVLAVIMKARMLRTLCRTAKENGFECVMSYNKDGVRTNIYVKSGYGGLNSLLMTKVAYVDGKVEMAVAALIGGVFTHEEILSLLKH